MSDPGGAQWRLWHVLLIAIVVGLLMACGGVLAPLQLVFELVLGWAFYLGRVASDLSWNTDGVVTAILTITLLAGGTHLLLSSFYNRSGSDGPTRREWRFSWTICLVSAVLVTFIAGMSFVGAAHQIGWLLASGDPITYSSAKEFTRPVSRSHLKAMGLGLHNYHGLNRRLPPGGTANRYGVPYHSWQTVLLPFLEVSDVPQGVDLSRPWDDPVNRAPFHESVPIFLSPRIDPVDAYNADGYALSHYAANSRLMSLNRSVRIKDITDGTSNTFAAGEVAEGFRPWGDPLNFRDPSHGFGRSPDGFGSPYEGGGHVLMMDGSVQFINNQIDPKLFEALGTPAGGEPSTGF